MVQFMMKTKPNWIVC